MDGNSDPWPVSIAVPAMEIDVTARLIENEEF